MAKHEAKKKEKGKERKAHHRSSIIRPTPALASLAHAQTVQSAQDSEDNPAE
jgi:hypothetical protein